MHEIGLEVSLERSCPDQPFVSMHFASGLETLDAQAAGLDRGLVGCWLFAIARLPIATANIQAALRRDSSALTERE